MSIIDSSKNLTIKLRNDVEVPIIGLGTSRFGHREKINDDRCKDCIKHALEVGYRHIDTATRYNNEHLVYKAIQESKIPRNEIFITTKLYPNCMGYHQTIKSFEQSCKQLHVQYIDLYLIHFPVLPGKKQSYEEARELRLDTWKAFEDLYKQGKCKAIGVSNYMPRHLQEIIDSNMTLPFVNQCEFNPYYTNKEVFDFCKKNDIAFEGYCPLAKGEVIKNEIIENLSKKYSKTPGNIALKWSIQNGIITIPSSWNFGRIEENFNCNDFLLDEEDMISLWNLNKDYKSSWNPTDVL